MLKETRLLTVVLKLELKALLVRNTARDSKRSVKRQFKFAWFPSQDGACQSSHFGTKTPSRTTHLRSKGGHQQLFCVSLLLFAEGLGGASLSATQRTPPRSRGAERQHTERAHHTLGPGTNAAEAQGTLLEASLKHH